MNGKKDIIPMMIAAAIALIVRAIIPGGGVAIQTQKEEVKKEIPLPDIPLMAKAVEIKEDQILMAAKDVKKDAKITLDVLTWKKWPRNAMQPYFIAKDEKGTPLNNGTDYTNALKIWADADIHAGVPLTMRMLTSEDPEKRKEEERKKKEEEEKKKREEEQNRKRQTGEDGFVKKGMRALTFQIDPKSPNFSGALFLGESVDIIVMEQRGDKPKAIKYRALRVLALDGLTSLNEKPNHNNNNNNGGGGLFGGLSAAAAVVSGTVLTHKNITLEIKAEMVEEMLKRVGSNGVIVLPRNQSEEEKASGEEIDENEDNRLKESLLQNILEMNRVNAAEALKKRRLKKKRKKLVKRPKKKSKRA